MVLALMGCATTPQPGVASDDGILNILPERAVSTYFPSPNATNPFIGAGLSLTTQPHYFLTILLNAPPSPAKSIEIDELRAVDSEGKLIGNFASRDELIEYWKQIDFDPIVTRAQVAVVERYYLPKDRLDGRFMGRKYGIVIMSNRMLVATDKVIGRIAVDGLLHEYTLEVGTAATPK